MDTTDTCVGEAGEDERDASVCGKEGDGRAKRVVVREANAAA